MVLIIERVFLKSPANPLPLSGEAATLVATARFACALISVPLVHFWIDIIGLAATCSDAELDWRLP